MFVIPYRLVCTASGCCFRVGLAVSRGLVLVVSWSCVDYVVRERAAGEERGGSERRLESRGRGSASVKSFDGGDPILCLGRNLASMDSEIAGIVFKFILSGSIRD